MIFCVDFEMGIRNRTWFLAEGLCHDSDTPHITGCASPELTATIPNVSVGLSKIVVNPQPGHDRAVLRKTFPAAGPMAPTHSNKRSCLTLLTDFGSGDTYVGQMKGIALSINPDAQLVDLTHEIPPQQILRGAYLWNDALDAFPTDTTHVAIVDPGVGSHRRLVAAEIGPYRLVCPDNGLLSVILQREPVRRVVSLDQPRWWRAGVSNTFHGRDILTPVAAAWSLGHDLAEFGSPMTTPLVTLTSAMIARGQTSLSGQVVHIDHFGNLITNITSLDLPAETNALNIEIGAFRVTGLSRCYADVVDGEAVAMTGSSGRLEIAIRNGNAAEELQADCGRRVVVRWEGSPA